MTYCEFCGDNNSCDRIHFSHNTKEPNNICLDDNGNIFVDDYVHEISVNGKILCENCLDKYTTAVHKQIRLHKVMLEELMDKVSLY